jgi:GT2 family glycosyltransferase
MLEQSYKDFEVIIVVDHNVELFEILSEKYTTESRVKVVLNNLGRGLSQCMNFGILRAEGSIVCFIDDDAVADKNWLKELAKAYNNDDGACAVGGRIEPLWVAGRPDYLPEEFYWMIGVTGNYLSNGVCEVRNLWSGNVSYKKYVFEKVGLFSPNLGRAGNSLLQGEDAEFGLRLLKFMKKGVKYVSTAVVYHKIYDDRVRLGSLVNRAFEQGYAKAYIRRLHGDLDALAVERSYLKLIIKWNLKKLSRLVLGPRRLVAVKQLAFTIIAIVTVLLGFLSGMFRAKP